MASLIGVRFFGNSLNNSLEGLRTLLTFGGSMDAMSYFIQTCAKNVVDNRNRARDKTYRYSTRLMYDRFAAKWEQMLIDKANFLISQGSN